MLWQATRTIAGARSQGTGAALWPGGSTDSLHCALASGRARPTREPCRVLLRDLRMPAPPPLTLLLRARCFARQAAEKETMSWGKGKGSISLPTISIPTITFPTITFPTFSFTKPVVEVSALVSDRGSDA